MVLGVLNVILTFVFLKKFVIFRNNGLWYGCYL